MLTPAEIQDRLDSKPGRHRLQIHKGAKSMIVLNVGPVKVNGSRSKSVALVWHEFGGQQSVGLGTFGDIPMDRLVEVADHPMPEVVGRRLQETPMDIPPFASYSRKVIARLEAKWKPSAALAQARSWTNELANHAGALADMKVSAITQDHVAGVLNGIASPVVAERVRMRIAVVMKHATIERLRDDGVNPADKLAQSILAAKPEVETEHHASCPYRKLADVIARLPDRPASNVVRFIALTGVRVNEATKADWSEIDLDAALWIIPKARMKAGQRHAVPLSKPAVALLQSLSPAESGLVFKGSRKGRPITRMTVSRAFQSACGDVRDPETGRVPTVHGLRSTLVEWGMDKGYDRADLMAHIAHLHGSEADRAYLRSAGFKRRKCIAKKWGRYLTE